MTVVKRGFFLSAIFIGFAFFAFAEGDSSDAAKIEKPNFQYKTVTTKEGLVFRVPEDMPIETRGGIQAPIPFDEYSYGKFAALEAKFSRLDKRLKRLEEKASVE